MKKPVVITQGWDVSLNHGAVVQLRTGRLDKFWYWTNLAGSAKKHDLARRLDIKKTDDRQVFTHGRLVWIKSFLSEIIRSHPPDFAGLEDYAIRAEQGAHYLGEVGGVARTLLWQHGIPYRTHDPIAVKMFATHDGSADKALIEEACRERWGVDFSKYNQPAPANKAKRQSRGTSEDLCDAYVMAKLVYVEAEIRAGRLLLTDLEHDHERRVFMRTTKHQPINLLGREWIVSPKYRAELAREAKEIIEYLKVTK